MPDFHANQSSQVDSVHTIKADLGVGGRELIVTSGIVLWDWVVRDPHLNSAVARVYLNVFARNLEAASAFVGLASIANEETGFTVATGGASVDMNPTTGELILTVHADVNGDTALNRFSYQVVATIVSVASMITGTITWSPDLYVPNPADVSTVRPQIFVNANKYDLVAAQPGLIVRDGQTEQLTGVATGSIESFDFDGKQCVAKYRIKDPPKGMQLKVTVSVDDQSFAVGTRVQVNRVAGPEVFVLTVNNLDAEVDFVIDRPIQIK